MALPNLKLFNCNIIMITNVASFLITSQSAFSTKVTVDKNGRITFDTSKNNSDKTVVLNRKNCNLTVIDKGSELTITDKNKVVDKVTDKKKKTSSLVCINKFKDLSIIKNGV